jgi:hypothetical protein
MTEPSPPPPAVHRARVPDAVVLQVAETGRATLLACFRRAQRADPTLGATKIKLDLEIDADGSVTAARTDVDEPHFNACLIRVARALHFPAPLVPASATLAFFAS